MSFINVGETKKLVSLNPCCNGIYSMRNLLWKFSLFATCLNPCCNGIYSMSIPKGAKGTVYSS